MKKTPKNTPKGRLPLKPTGGPGLRVEVRADPQRRKVLGKHYMNRYRTGPRR
jgi:hypothetical protein